MKTALEEFDALLKEQLHQRYPYEVLQGQKLNVLAKHIDEIEKTLRYLVDRKVEEKYPSGSKRFTKGISDGK